ncbi:hypothetical protein ACS3SW_04195 [Roseobacteraceae bacterium S113]
MKAYRDPFLRPDAGTTRHARLFELIAQEADQTARAEAHTADDITPAHAQMLIDRAQASLGYMSPDRALASKLQGKA